MFNPNEWKAGSDGTSVVAGGETICCVKSESDRSLILAAPQMHAFLQQMAQYDSEAAEYAGRLVAVAEGRAASVLLPYDGGFEESNDDDEDDD